MTEHVTDGDGGSVVDGVIAAVEVVGVIEAVEVVGVIEAVEVVGVAEVLTHVLDIDEA